MKRGGKVDTRARILVVDDEEVMRDSLSSWLREDGFEVDAVADGFAALKRVKQEDWDLLLVDLKMPGINGIETMKEVKKLREMTPVVIITAYATVDTAVAAMKEGAYDYIVKPFNPEEISLTIRKIVEHQNLLKENVLLRKELRKSYQFQDLISKNHKMQDIFQLVKSVAQSDSTVLIQGKSGTGKELVARAIHDCSPRKDKPFVVASCAALPEGLLESELFGHEKGAFTGAVSLKKGTFELADRGSIFLDEIGEISPKTQVDLLRVLEEKRFRRVGGTREIEVDVRVISATNRDLKEAVDKGEFREDLYYRLNVVSVQLPPLRERKEDIPLLAAHFLKKFRVKNRKDFEGISAEALNILMRYHWPGNVRELENAVERAVVVGKGGLITANDLPVQILQAETALGTSSELSLQEMEKEHIRRVLDRNKWNIKRAAEQLGINRTTLYHKMKRYGLRSVENSNS